MVSLRQEKQNRDKACRDKYGNKFEYDPSIDVMKYKNEFDLKRNQPFSLKDCKEIPAEIKPDTDKEGRYYINANTPVKCKMLKGYWNPESVSRVDKKYKGVCWKTVDDRDCANYDETALIKGDSVPTNMLFIKSKRNCESDNKCLWEKNECISKVTARRSWKLPDDWPSDVTSEGFQEYLNQYFLGFKRLPPQTQPLMGEGNRCTAAAFQNPLLSLHQEIVHVVAMGMAKYDNSNRGLLVVHSTGSGKTCTATSVMDAFWDTKKNIVFVTSVEALNSNPPKNFHSCASRFFKRFTGLNEDKIRAMFEKRAIKFMTFAQLAHFLLIAKALKRVKKPEDIEKHKRFLDDAVLIIDEVHNIFKPLPTQRLENDAVRKFLTDPQNPYTSKLKLFILTATPGDDIKDLVTLLNMVRDRTKPMIDIPSFEDQNSISKFGDSVKGLVSFFDMSKDFSKFPKVNDSHQYTLRMSLFQFMKYAEAYHKIPDAQKNYQTLAKNNQLNKYLKYARKYSNMLYDISPEITLQEFSTKIPKLLENVQKYSDQKHYIYSSFYENRGHGGQGILAIAKYLESELGYTKLSLEDAKGKTLEQLEKKKRYVLAITNELGEDKNNLNAIVKMYNQSQNIKGEYIHVFLASQGYNEGVDLRGVKHVHIFEPLITFAMDKQTIGRAARYCSHSDLDHGQGEWTVSVHRYISDQPEDLSTFNLNYLQDRIKYLEEEVVRMDTLEKETKKRLTLEQRGLDTAYIELIQEISTYKKNIQELKKKAKEVEKLNIKSVEMVDEKISQEAKKRIQEMTFVYNAMKLSAVDYLVFRDFHEF
jgi:hypothetical protein